VGETGTDAGVGSNLDTATGSGTSAGADAGTGAAKVMVEAAARTVKNRVAIRMVGPLEVFEGQRTMKTTIERRLVCVGEMRDQ
jgi:hypothetical protein